ncbi:hypothetical protein SNEBB_011272 [Seison nebaliae]|nr:hypothetical protein SNEBB_011272 [Seison nebaliae]
MFNLCQCALPILLFLFIAISLTIIITSSVHEYVFQIGHILGHFTGNGHHGFQGVGNAMGRRMAKIKRLNITEEIYFK